MTVSELVADVRYPAITSWS